MELTTASAVFHSLAMIVTAVFVFLAWRHSERAEDAQRHAMRELAKVLALRGEISGHGSQLDSLEKQLQRLRGQFHAERAKVDAKPEEQESAEAARARLRAQLPIPRIGAEK